MFDVYVKGSQFLVIRRGSPIPADLASGWKKKRAVRHVSEEIKAVVVREGFFARSHIAHRLDRHTQRCQGDLCWPVIGATLSDRCSPLTARIFF
jgi:hypothetical protein